MWFWTSLPHRLPSSRTALPALEARQSQASQFPHPWSLTSNFPTQHFAAAPSLEPRVQGGLELEKNLLGVLLLLSHKVHPFDFPAPSQSSSATWSIQECREGCSPCPPSIPKGSFLGPTKLLGTSPGAPSRTEKTSRAAPGSR